MPRLLACSALAALLAAAGCQIGAADYAGATFARIWVYFDS